VSRIGVGGYVRYHRLRAKLTQEELATKAGISVRALRDIERGRAQNPRPQTVEMLADGLGLTDGDREAMLVTVDAAPSAGAARPRTRCVPPPPPPSVTGRERESRVLADRARRAETGGALDVVVVHGPPGVGKTTLVLHAAEQLGDGFPDGVLFLDLLGAQGKPLDPQQATTRLLLAFGMDQRDIPGDPEQCLALYRSVLAHHSVLLVVDNPSTEAHVRPLLAPSPGSMVLVSSRNALVGLDATARVQVEPLTADPSVEMLCAIIGRTRADAEPEAVRRVVELCGGMPLALRIAGNRLATRPAWPIARMVELLDDESRRLSVLSAGDVQVEAAFALSYRALDPVDAQVFRRLSVIPGPDTGTFMAGVVVDLPEAVAEDASERLVDAGLLIATATPGRYGFHDLLRLYAGQRLEADEGAESAAALRRRTHDWLLATAVRAAMFFDPDVAPSDDRGLPFRDCRGAMAWMEDETSNWRGAFRDAFREGRDRRVAETAVAMHWYSQSRGDVSLWFEVFSAGAVSAERLGWARHVAVLQNLLSWANLDLLFRPHDGVKANRAAMAAAVAAGDDVQIGYSHLMRGHSEWRLGTPHNGLEHIDAGEESFGRAGYETGELQAISLGAMILTAASRFDEAVEKHRRAVARLRARRHVNVPIGEEMLGSFLVRLASPLILSGRYDEAAEVLDEAERLFTRQGSSPGLTDARRVRARLLRRTERLDQALEQLLLALRTADRRHAVRDVFTALAQTYEALDDPAAATAYRVRAVSLYGEYDLREVQEDRNGLLALVGPVVVA